MIQVAIVEDDKNYAASLKKYILRYEEEQNIKFSVEWFEDGEDIAEEYKGHFDIILMDIEMQFMDGMSAAKKIREVDEEVIIMFITNSPQYAMQGYAVDALDYVLKPINYYAFSQRLTRALSKMKKQEETYLTLNYRGGVQKIRISDLYYVEVRDHDLIYHTKDGNLMIRGTMREAEENLKEESFFRCNKAYLVNLEYVDGFENGDALVGGERLMVSRARKKEFLDALNNYMNEVG
ncbi:MAG: LytTR family DNA-binding domain-containing protein [Lachnospiraceae bacterium]|nr:LytTR family DNA-binding domain-containing protein [Lachnospiraceae bacterium]